MCGRPRSRKEGENRIALATMGAALPAWCCLPERAWFYREPETKNRAKGTSFRIRHQRPDRRIHEWKHRAADDSNPGPIVALIRGARGFIQISQSNSHYKSNLWPFYLYYQAAWPRSSGHVRLSTPTTRAPPGAESVRRQPVTRRVLRDSVLLRRRGHFRLRARPWATGPMTTIDEHRDSNSIGLARRRIRPRCGSLTISHELP